MPGQQLAHCWRQMEETETGQQARLISEHDSKVRVILRVKQRKQIGLFSGGSHPGLPQGPDEKGKQPSSPFCPHPWHSTSLLRSLMGLGSELSPPRGHQELGHREGHLSQRDA